MFWKIPGTRSKLPDTWRYKFENQKFNKPGDFLKQPRRIFDPLGFFLDKGPPELERVDPIQKIMQNTTEQGDAIRKDMAKRRRATLLSTQSNPILGKQKLGAGA